MNKCEIGIAVNKYLAEPKSRNIGFQTLNAKPSTLDHSKLVNWIEFAGEEGSDITIDKIPLFLRKEQNRLRREEKRRLKDAETPVTYLQLLRESINILRRSGNVDSPKRKEQASTYFLRELAVAKYISNNDIGIFLSGESGEERLSWLIITSCESALKVL